MTDPAAVALKFGFIAVLYLFLLWVARSSLRDLRRREDYEDVEGGDRLDERHRGGVAEQPRGHQRLEVVAALGREPGQSLALGHEATIGRAPTSDVRIDDPFASSAHARLFVRGEYMYIEDMGSTNGTYLNRRPLRRAERLGDGDTIRIGDSEYRYRE